MIRLWVRLPDWIASFKWFMKSDSVNIFTFREREREREREILTCISPFNPVDCLLLGIDT
jgi:hypothetical protein